MIKILIVDDSIKRVEKFNDAFNNLDNKNYCKLDIAYCANDAENFMANNQYDLLILDVILPKKERDTSTAITGLNLLKNINKTNSRLLLPKKTIGITSNNYDIENFRKDFNKYTSNILQAAINSKTWIKQVISNINNLVNTEIQKDKFNTEKLLITFHGIRTFGNWQEDIENKILNKTNNFEFERMKYNFFSIFLFIIPFTRSIIVRYLSKDFETILRNNQNKEVYIISHSFGTYISIKLLEKSNINTRINTLILSGSVMPSTYDLNKILEKNVKKIVNECARDDYTLMLCKVIVPFFGDAGRIGFIGRNNNNILINRFYKGGHSSYFKNLDKTDNIIIRKWLPILLDSSFSISTEIEKITPNLLSDIIEPTLTLVSYIKNIIFCLFIIWVFIYLFDFLKSLIE